MAKTLNCVVRAGKVLAHEGQELTAGEAVDLLEHVAYEVRDMVLVVGRDGQTAPVESLVKAPGSIEAELETARPHERQSLIDAHRASLQAQLDALDNLAPPDAPQADEPAPAPKPAKAPAGKAGKPADAPAKPADADAPQGQQ